MTALGTPLIDYYQVLGVPRSANDLEIRNAHRRKLRESHPDVNPGIEATRLLLVNEAYDILSDPDLRRQHDLFLETLGISEPRQRRRWLPWLLVLLLLLLLGTGVFGPRYLGVDYWSFLRGAAGAAGLPGMDGADGADGLPGRDGSDGQDGRNGLPGIDGSSGQDGADGLIGRDGVDGVDGINGADGINGLNGTDGLNGRDGVDGINGQDGAPGPIGPTGPASGVIDFGQGALTAVGCDVQVKLAMTSFYNGTDFFLNSLSLEQVDEACNGQTLRIFLLTDTSRSGAYDAADIILCERSLSGLSGGSNIITFGRSSTCTIQGTSTTLRLDQIFSRDVSAQVGGIAIEIA